MIMILSFRLCLCPFLSVPATFFPPFSLVLPSSSRRVFPLFVIMTQSPSPVLRLCIPCSYSSLCLCLSHFPRRDREGKKNLPPPRLSPNPSIFLPAVGFVNILPNSLITFLSLSFPCLFTPFCAPGFWPLLLLLPSFTRGYDVEIRLSVPFCLSGLLHCFGLSPVAFPFLLCYFGDRVVRELLTFDLKESP